MTLSVVGAGEAEAVDQLGAAGRGEYHDHDHGRVWGWQRRVGDFGFGLGVVAGGY